MGLPGAGKTTLAEKLVPKLRAIWINADKVRKDANDWDFSSEGRNRQAKRMKDLAEQAIKQNRFVVADFVCPTNKTREEFNADYLVWMDTIKSGRFNDTNKIFEPPIKYDLRIETKDAEKWSNYIIEKLKNEIDK